jgi:hypothetical protein
MFPSGTRLSRRHVLSSAAAFGVAPLITAQFAMPVLAAAPMLCPSRPTHYRFKLGAFELTTILDADAFIDGPWPLIGANASEGEVDQLMRDNLLLEKKYQPGFTPLIINTGKELVLVDTGNGAKGFVPRPHGAGSQPSSSLPASSRRKSTWWSYHTATLIISVG